MTDVSARVVESLRLQRHQLRLLGFAVLVFLAFSLAAPGVFPTGGNLQSMGLQFPETGLLGLGVMLSMVTGGIDLSVVAIADLCAVAMGEYFSYAGVTAAGNGSWGVVAVGVLIALAIGAACGLLNGLLIGRVGVTAILATLGTMNLFGGLALAWTGGKALLGLPNHLLTSATMAVAGVPVPTLVFIVAALLTALLLNGSRFGLRMILVGANRTAARFSGIREPRVVLGTYAASGTLAAVAGVVIASRTASASPDYGASYILLSVVIAVLAGVNPNGGFGTVWGVLLAALILQMVQTGFDILNFNQFLYQAAQGVLLVGVLAINTWLSADRRWKLRRRPPSLPADTRPEQMEPSG